MTGLRETQFALRAAVDGFDAAFHADSSREEDHEAATALRDAAEAAIAALADSWTEDDTCTVGDVDPTPASWSTCGAEDQGWTCTRAAGHPGRQHIAGNGQGRRVVHVWPWSPDDQVDHPAGIAGAFTWRELETLVRTAAEAVHGDLDDLSSRQVELADRAHELLQQEAAGE